MSRPVARRPSPRPLAVATGLDPGVSTRIGRREHLGLGSRSAVGGEGGAKADPLVSDPGEWAPMLVTEQVWRGGTELPSHGQRCARAPLM